MDRDEKLRIIKFSLLLGGVIVLLVGIYLTVSFYEKRNALPQDFIESRNKATEISGEIVRLSNETNVKIKELGSLEPEVNREKAFALIEEARRKNDEAFKKSLELSYELERLARGLPEIKSTPARQTMYQAITVEISLVTEYVAYTEDLNKFLESVQEYVENNSQENRFRVQSDERAVNERVATINRLNDEFLDYIKRVERSFN